MGRSQKHTSTSSFLHDNFRSRIHWKTPHQPFVTSQPIVKANFLQPLIHRPTPNGHLAPERFRVRILGPRPTNPPVSQFPSDSRLTGGIWLLLSPMLVTAAGAAAEGLTTFGRPRPCLGAVERSCSDFLRHRPHSIPSRFALRICVHKSTSIAQRTWTIRTASPHWSIGRIANMTPPRLNHLLRQV